MAQYVYSLGALAGVILLSLMINSGRLSAERQVYVNEAATQMLSLADEIIDLVDRPDIQFDSKTAGLRAYEANVDSLTSPDEFGGCNALSSCADVDDFHGMRFPVSNQGMEYDAAISVAYVSRTNPDSVVSTPTMSKLVTVDVRAKSVMIGDDSLWVSVSRVVPYR